MYFVTYTYQLQNWLLESYLTRFKIYNKYFSLRKINITYFTLKYQLYKCFKLFKITNEYTP